MFGSRDISVYCHMGDFGCGSGGWTPVMKTDGNKVKDGGEICWAIFIIIIKMRPTNLLSEYVIEFTQ